MQLNSMNMRHSQANKLLYDRVFASCPGSHRNTRAAELRFGEAHYSYDIYYDKFAKMFELFGRRLELVPRPEIYSTEESRKYLGSNLDGCPHLIFKPFENVRILKGAYNIACIAWEFNLVQTQKTAKRPLLPMEDYCIVANILDEIWTPSTYAVNAMHAAGINNARFVPIPIWPQNNSSSEQVRQLPDIALSPLIMNGPLVDYRKAEGEPSLQLGDIFLKFYNGNKPKVFLMVFNPGDMRKNPGVAVRAFLEYNALYTDSILIIKLVWNHEFGDMFDVIDTHLRGRMGALSHVNTRSIWITDESLPKATFMHLLGGTDFYVCTSFCEGQNMPLLEAMSLGVVPLSVDHTAMRDYINDNNSVVIPSYPTVDEINISVAKDIAGAQWYAIKDSDLVNGFTLAHDMTSMEYASKSQNARRIVCERYSPEAVASLIGLGAAIS